MRVAKVDNQAQGMRKQVLKSAGAGAALTGGVLAASQGYYWVAKNDAMKQLVQEYGGKAPYFKQFALGAVLVTAASAALSGLVTYAANKIHPVKPPKAAN